MIRELRAVPSSPYEIVKSLLAANFAHFAAFGN